MGLFWPKHFAIVVGPEYTSWHKIRTIGPALWPVHREQTDKCSRQTNRGDQYTLQKSTILQSNERALLECILCKIGLTDWVIYLVDWLWQRSRTQSIGPNDSNEKCAMSRVLLRINIAAMQKIRDLDLLHLTLTFSLDLWPWYLTLRLICCYIDALKKTLQNVLFWRHVTQKRHLIR